MYGSGHTSAGGRGPHRWKSPFRLVCVVGSLGALAPCRSLLERLPVRLPAPVVVLQHRLSGSAEPLTDLLAASCDLPVTELTERQVLQPGHVYVTPGRTLATVLPDGSSGLCVTLRPDSSRHPADHLLQSATRACGAEVLAVVLSGRLDDAAIGVRHVRGAGGRVLVQSPETCSAVGMPQAALSSGCADFALAPASLGDAITALCMAPGVSSLMRVPLASWATPLSTEGLAAG